MKSFTPFCFAVGVAMLLVAPVALADDLSFLGNKKDDVSYGDHKTHFDKATTVRHHHKPLAKADYYNERARNCAWWPHAPGD